MPLVFADIAGGDLLLLTLFNGLTEGSTYALIAVGYTMVYGIIKLINFAHGEVYMIGAVVAWWLFADAQLPLWLALPLSMGACALLGYWLDRLAYKPLRHSTRLAALITAIGMSLILQTLVQLVLDADYHSFPETARAVVLESEQGSLVGRAAPEASAVEVARLATGRRPPIHEVQEDWVALSWDTGQGHERVWVPREGLRLEQGLPEVFNEDALPEDWGLKIKLPKKDVLIWVVAALMMGGLQLLVMRTKVGRGMRACALDQTTAALMGVNVDRVITLTFVIGSAMAAVAGVLYSLKVGGNIYFRMGYYPGVIAFAAAVLGGIGNLKGALLGGLLLGFTKAFCATYVSSSYDFAACFLVMILVIIFRPYGILGKPGASRA